MAVVMSQEELAYLLRLMGQRGLRGVTLDLAGDDTELEQALLGTAERSLRARGWVRVDAQNFSIETTVMGTLGFCVNAPHSLTVRRTAVGQQPHVRTYHMSPALTVQHVATEGVHGFDVVEGRLIDDVLTQMYGGETIQDVPRGPIVGLTAGVLVSGAALAQDPNLTDEEAAEVLRDVGATGDVDALLHFYRHDWLANVILGMWSPDDDEDRALSSYGFLQGRSGWWVIYPGVDAQVVELQPITRAQLTEIVDEALRMAVSPVR